MLLPDSGIVHQFDLVRTTYVNGGHQFMSPISAFYRLLQIKFSFQTRINFSILLCPVELYRSQEFRFIAFSLEVCVCG